VFMCSGPSAAVSVRHSSYSRPCASKGLTHLIFVSPEGGTSVLMVLVPNSALPTRFVSWFCSVPHVLVEKLGQKSKRLHFPKLLFYFSKLSFTKGKEAKH